MCVGQIINNMERYRTSLHSTSPINRSNLSEGYVKSNLESRIDYETSQVSLIAVIKALLVAAALAGLLLGTAWVLQGPASVADECGARAPGLAGYVNRLRYRFLGGENPDKCEHTVRKTQDVVGDGKTVQTITSTTTCTTDLDRPVAAEAKSFWSYLRLPFFGCDEYKQHKAALNDQHFSVTGRLPAAPRLEDVATTAYQRTTTKTTTGTGSTTTVHESHTVSSDQIDQIAHKFDQLIPNAGLGIEGQTAYISRTEENQIQGIKPLLDDKNIFDLQLKVNDLVHSYQNLKKKRAALNDFRKSFFGNSKSPTECTTEVQELNRKIDIEREKLSYSRSNHGNLEAALKDVQDRLADFIKRQRSDEQEPLRIQAKLEEDIQELNRAIASAGKSHAEIEIRRRDRTNKLSEIDRIQKLIDAANQEIKAHDFDKNLRRNEIEELYKKLKLSEGKRSLWEVKLEFALRNKHIKEFLMTLVNTKEGKDKDLQALFVDKISSERELKVVLREFINQSRSSKNEMPISDEQIDSIIKQDEKDFEDITRLYKELVKIISEYKDIDIDIVTMRRQIESVAANIAEYQTQIDAAKHRLNDLDALIAERQAAIRAREHDIGVIRDRITQDDSFIDRHVIDIPDLERRLTTKQQELFLLNEQYKKSFDRHSAERQRLLDEQARLKNDIDNVKGETGPILSAIKNAEIQLEQLNVKCYNYVGFYQKTDDYLNVS